MSRRKIIAVMTHKRTDNFNAAVSSMTQEGREAVGDSAYKISYPSASGKGMVAKKSTTTDGDLTGGGGARTHAGRLGAGYRVQAAMPAPRDEIAQSTQANGKIIPPTHRAGKQFWSQASGY